MLFVSDQLASIASGGISFSVGIGDTKPPPPRRLPPLPVTPDHQAIAAAIEVRYLCILVHFTCMDMCLSLFSLICQAYMHFFGAAVKARF